jgi:hypothetical protein
MPERDATYELQLTHPGEGFRRPGIYWHKRKVNMGALAEAIITAFDSNTEIAWTTKGPSVAIASFTEGAAKVTTTFSKTRGTEWQVAFDVASDRRSANEIAQSSIRIFSGVFQAVREFLEVRQRVTLVFASKNEPLGELYEVYLKRQDTTLAQMGYEMEPVTKSSPSAEFTIRKTTSSAWRG